MKRYKLHETRFHMSKDIISALTEDHNGEWVKYKDIERTFQLAKIFSEIHIGDGDCLGDMAREFYNILKELDVDKIRDEFNC